jgi:hypothetical protein
MNQFLIRHILLRLCEHASAFRTSARLRKIRAHPVAGTVGIFLEGTHDDS